MTEIAGIAVPQGLSPPLSPGRDSADDGLAGQRPNIPPRQLNRHDQPPRRPPRAAPASSPASAAEPRHWPWPCCGMSIVEGHAFAHPTSPRTTPWAKSTPPYTPSCPSLPHERNPPSCCLRKHRLLGGTTRSGSSVAIRFVKKSRNTNPGNTERGERQSGG
jgi:hypothetical protein